MSVIEQFCPNSILTQFSGDELNLVAQLYQQLIQ